MFLGRIPLGESIVFPAQTIDTGGSAANAAAAPSYLVIQDEGAVPAAGVMAQAFGQIGFYLETLAITAPTYAVGSTYTIRISATVDGETPAAVHTFMVVAPVTIPSAATIAAAVWDETVVGHAHAQTFGALQYLLGGWINQVVADAANTTTSFRTDYGLTYEGQLLGKILYISSGANAGAARIITGYDPVTDFVTVAPALPFVPTPGTVIPRINIPTFWQEIWKVLKTAAQGETIMGNIAEDTDNLQFRGEEG